MNHDERMEAAEEARLRELLETVRDERPARPELRDAVMSEIAALPSPVWRRLNTLYRGYWLRCWSEGP